MVRTILALLWLASFPVLVLIGIVKGFDKVDTALFAGLAVGAGVTVGRLIRYRTKMRRNDNRRDNPGD